LIKERLKNLLKGSHSEEKIKSVDVSIIMLNGRTADNKIVIQSKAGVAKISVNGSGIYVELDELKEKISRL